jgi:hypothetical protein
MAKLAAGVETELQKRMHDVNSRAKQATENIDELSSRIDLLKQDLINIQRYMSSNLNDAFKRSNDLATDNIQSATSLQDLLSSLIDNVYIGSSQLATAYEVSLGVATQKAADEMVAVLTLIETAAATSTVLQNQIDISRLQAAEIASRQNMIEQVCVPRMVLSVFAPAADLRVGNDQAA